MASQTYHRSDNAEMYRNNASFVYSSAYTSAVMQLLDPQPAEHILDLGCGSGELTLQLANAVGPTGRIVGQDASQDMIAKATQLVASSSSCSRLRAPIELIEQQAEMQLPREHHGSFDKVFSNAALHWMKRDPGLVLSNVFCYLRPGGRFAAEMGGFLNTVGVRSHLHAALSKRGVDPQTCDPWFFPTPAQYHHLLEQAGFKVESCELVPRITQLPQHSGIKGWLSTFAGPFLAEIHGDQNKAQLVQEVEDALRPDCYDEHSQMWSVMYVRLRVLAFKPESSR